MNDNTILRIKVPAHLYESVKKQLTINEAKGSSTPKGWTVVKEKKMTVPKDGMEKVEELSSKSKVEEGDDKKLKIKKLARKKDAKSFAKLLDKNNIDFEWLDVDNVGNFNDGIFNIKVNGTDFLFINGELDSIDGEMIENVEEDKGYMGTDYASSEDMAVGMIKKETKEKDNSMQKKRTLEELTKAKAQIDKKIEEMSKSEAPMNEDLTNTALQLLDAVKDLDAQAFMDIASKTLGIAPNELKNLFIPGAAGAGVVGSLAAAARKDKKAGRPVTVKAVD